ncbi:MAG TPA: hypothetical protein VFQ61_36685, partial [Polyangiaceae bacterium]|nr:hypothetical protein [Polyangiaceae bacterium]
MYRASEPPDLGPTTLLTNEFVHVRSLPGEQIIEVWRSERPARTLAEVDESWGKVERVLSCVARAHRSLLLDMRQARGRNDPAFESAVAE